MAVDKTFFQVWIVPIVVGIAIIIGAALIFGLAGLYIKQDRIISKVKGLEEKQDKYELKQDKLIIGQGDTNSTLKLLVYQVKQNNDIMKEIKANQRGSFALYIEHKRAKNLPLKDNLQIASRLP